MHTYHYRTPSRQDITHFFRPQVEDARIVDGTLRMVRRELAGEGPREHEIGELSPAMMNGNRNIIIGGIPVYDNVSSTVKYEARLTSGHNGLKNVERHGYHLMPLLRNAVMAERDLVFALASSGIPAGFTTEIISFGEDYYLVVAHVTPDSAKDVHLVHKGLAKIVSQLGVKETIH